MMDMTKDAVARRLAQAHRTVEPGISRIVRLRVDETLESDPKEPVKLLEVNKATFAAGVRPVYFAPSTRHGIAYPTAIVEVTPEEFEHIESGTMSLPDGWLLAEVIVPAKTSKAKRS